jgi:predicted nucleotidyltransferase
MELSSSTDSIIERLSRLAREYRVQIFYAFGSRAAEIRAAVDETGKLDPANAADIDVAVKLFRDETLSIREKAELAIELEDLFGAGRVDLVLLADADPFLAANIIRGERLFCRDEHAADVYELYVLRRAGDLAPFERERIESVLNR